MSASSTILRKPRSIAQPAVGWHNAPILLNPLYERMKNLVLASKVAGTDDTPVKVRDRNLPQTRKGRIWPYTGDRNHPEVVYDYTPTRERSGPEKFLQNIGDTYRPLTTPSLNSTS